MDYMTTKQAAEKWQISDRRVLQYCNDGRIDGAERKHLADSQNSQKAR